MGFYGSIKNTTKTQFSFDRVYPNRVAMDNACREGDGIYVGRYVLVEYDEDVNREDFLTAYLIDGALYKTLPTDGTVFGHLVFGEDVQRGDIVCVPAEFNKMENTRYDKYYIIEGTKTIEACEHYTYDETTKELIPVVAEDSETEEPLPVSLTVPDFRVIVDEDSPNNYISNFNIDRVAYGASRGYDSTVWQKTSSGGEQKYVMIAELNTVIPTLDIDADAPSIVPKVPHFDSDSTNQYYKLHLQPTWGLRIKGSQGDLTTPYLTNSGAVESIESAIPVSTDRRKYPSDESTEWTKELYDTATGEIIKEYYGGDGKWHESKQSIDGAIYYNKAGFDMRKPAYSTDLPDAEDINPDVRDEFVCRPDDSIQLTSTGVSGHKYNTHTKNGLSRDAYPDTQELSIMLPSIGDTIAKVWDVMYGDREANGYDKNDQEAERNTTVGWVDATSEYANASRLRMVAPIEGELSGKTYNTKAVSTVAGAINSMHDLMGMIITVKKDGDNDIEEWNPDYIYYDKSNGKYYYKSEDYDYTVIETQEDFENGFTDAEVSEEPWEENKYYYKSADEREYILNPEYREGTTYYRVIGADEVYISKDYQPGTQYRLYDQGEDNLVGKYYALDLNEESTIGAKYFDLKEVEILSKPNKVIEVYIPNMFYYSIYRTADIDGNSYVPGKYYYIDPNAWFSHMYDPPRPLFDEEQINAMKVPGSNYWIEHIDERQYISEKPCEDIVYNEHYIYIKREYELDTNPYPSAGRVYYKFKGVQNVGGNAKYTKLATADPIELSEGGYLPNTYFYVAEGGYVPTEDDRYEIIHGSIYLCDSGATPTEDRQYYKVRIEYILSEASIEITDENLDLVEQMYSLDKYPEDTITSKGIICFERKDDRGNVQYVPLNYSNHRYAVNSGEGKPVYVLAKFLPISEIYYKPDTYWYIANTAPYPGSYILDGSLTRQIDQTTTTEIDPETGEEITVPGTYKQYYANVTLGNPIKNFYIPNKYYYKDEDDRYVYATGDIRPNGDLFEKLDGPFVYHDERGIYKQGTPWTGTQDIDKLPGGVTLAWGKKIASRKELVGFAKDFTTVNGLLLRLSRTLEENNTRKDDGLNGLINQVNDLLSKFAELQPETICMVDEYGRIVGSEIETDAWIEVEIDPTVEGQSISISHTTPNANSGNTAVSASQTPKFGATFDIIQNVETDAQGHVIDKGTTTVTVPQPSLTNGTGNVVTGISLTAEDGAFTETKANVGTLALTGYKAATAVEEVSATDTINSAIGKLQKAINQEVSDRAQAIEDAIDGLTEDDIPTLGMDKIDGLEDALGDKQDIIPENTYDAYGSASAVLGTEDDEATVLTVNGLSKRIDGLENGGGSIEEVGIFTWDDNALIASPMSAALYKNGHICVLGMSFELSETWTGSDSYFLGTLPEGFRPSIPVSALLSLTGAPVGTGAIDANCTIFASGQVYIDTGAITIIPDRGPISVSAFYICS